MQRDYDAMIRASESTRSQQDEAENQSRVVLDDFVDLLSGNGVSGLPFYSETFEDSPEYR